MNLFLARTLTFFNSLLAPTIIACGLIVVYLIVGGDTAALRPIVSTLESLLNWVLTPTGVVAVAAVTLMVVGYLCGIVAFLSLMEPHLRAIRMDIKRGAVRTGFDLVGEHRQTPVRLMTWSGAGSWYVMQVSAWGIESPFALRSPTHRAVSFGK